MKILAPFAGPVSFPLLVYKHEKQPDLELINSCTSTEVNGDVILDSITNLSKMPHITFYKIVGGVYITMYSLVGNLASDVIYTVKEGTLADYNARLYALKTGKKRVINVDPQTAVENALKNNYLALVGNEVRVDVLLDEEFKRLGIYTPQCLIAVKDNVDAKPIIDMYEEGISLIKMDYEKASQIIVSSSNYYSLDIMRQIIRLYNHRLTTRKEDLEKAIEVYSLVEPNAKRLRLI